MANSPMRKAAHRPRPIVQGQENAFLQAILEKPDDDALRLAFADWLEERGDPWGEFIRVQCALAAMSDNDPSRPPLVRRERALLTEHSLAWAGALPQIVTAYEYHRGFIDTVVMGTGKFLTHAAKLFDQAPIQSLRLTRLGQSVSGSMLAACPELARLRHLALAGQLEFADLQQLLCCPHLRRLTSLAMPDWHHAIRGDFSGPVILQALRTRSPARLERLDLDNTGISTELAQELADMPALAKLTHLNLSHNPIRGTGAQALAASPHLRRLVSLRLHDCAIGVHAGAALVSSLPRLTTLDLRRNRLADSGVRAIAASSPQNLRELYLGMNNLTAASIEALVNWPGLARLTLLHLYGNDGIGDAEVTQLSRSDRIRELQHLDLAGTNVGDEGLQALAEGPHAGKLRYLNVPQGQAITDTGVTALARSPVLKRLQHLNLRYSSMTDRGARALADSPYLSDLLGLDVRDTRLTKAGKNALLTRFGADPCTFE